MKIAIPTKKDNQIDDHFGHCEFYTIFALTEDRKIFAETILESPKGCGCKSNIASELAEMDVKILLAGGIGEGAISKLAQHNIEVIRNCKGDVHQLVTDYLNDKLVDGGSSCTSHGHTHSEGHVCNH